jgi:protein-S-isoprenylcysteine O-methyltransferase Ste14
VDGGTLLSTAGLTAGVDATLHLLARRHGAELATRVAEALHIPPSPYLENPKCRQFEFAPADSIFLLNAGFRWPKTRLRVWLYDGVGELELGSTADVYGVSAAYQIHTQATSTSVVSSHGIQFVPREQVQTVPSDGSLRSDGSSRQFAYVAAVEDLARRQDAWTARFAAKRLEIRTPLRIEGDSWSVVVLAPLLIGGAAMAVLFCIKGAVQTERRTDLELRVPPVALGVIAAALMWCAASATPDFDFLFPSNRMFTLALALLGALTCLAGVLAFRRAKTTVNPMNLDSTSSLVVSGIYGYTRNPMYLGFLLLLLAWAAALSNVLALVSLLAFVLYINRFQIVPEERVLASRFARDYAEYRVHVRRWL